jgi:PAS domain S-box-containing protein
MKPKEKQPPRRVIALEEMAARWQRTEVRILQGRGHFRQLAEMLPEAVYEADSAANLTYFNRNGIRQFNIPDAGMVSKLTVFDLVSPKEQQRVKVNFRRIASGKETGCHAYTAIRHDGETFPALFYCMTIFQNRKPTGVRGFIRDITACREAESAIETTHHALEQKATGLKEANIAFKVLLKQREADKAAQAENIQANVETLILPYLERIKKGHLLPDQRAMLNVLEANLRDIVSPFSHSLAAVLHRLTPMEIRVANLIKHGKTTKDIAQLLRLAPSTILTHRDHIREKLNIKNCKINLRTHLQSLE